MVTDVCSVGAGDRRRGVVGFVVDDDHLVGRRIERRQRTEQDRQADRLVAGRHDHRDLRCRDPLMSADARSAARRARCPRRGRWRGR